MEEKKFRAIIRQLAQCVEQIASSKAHNARRELIGRSKDLLDHAYWLSAISSAKQSRNRENKMADDKKKKGKADRSRVNVNEPYEVQYWSRKFGVSAAKLRATVKKVGTSVAAVQKALK